MRPFNYAKATTTAAAVEATGAVFLAGGTTLVDLMKLEVLTPARVVDINDLPLRGIRLSPSGLRIGALERMSDIAGHPLIRTMYPVVSQALGLSASQQIRNMASIGGNLMQRTRCSYYRDVATPCNRRTPGSGCAAITGFNRMHAILGTSDSCVATHPSDVAVALVALDANVELLSTNGVRTVPLAGFYRAPGSTPQIENEIRPGELITAITVPMPFLGWRSTYLKIRDRASYEFALTSAAVALHVKGKRIEDARVAVGGVGTIPWRLPAVEAALRGAAYHLETFQKAAERAGNGAKTLKYNAFKVPLLKRTLVRALMSLEGR